MPAKDEMKRVDIVTNNGGGGGSAEIPWMTVDNTGYYIRKDDGSYADLGDFKNGAVLMEKRSSLKWYYYVFPCDNTHSNILIRPQMIALNSVYV